MRDGRGCTSTQAGACLCAFLLVLYYERFPRIVTCIDLSRFPVKCFESSFIEIASQLHFPKQSGIFVLFLLCFALNRLMCAELPRVGRLIGA